MRNADQIVEICHQEWQRSRLENREARPVDVTRDERKALLRHFWTRTFGHIDEATDEELEVTLETQQSRVFNVPLKEVPM